MLTKMQKKINKRKQKNNHARTKRRLKVLRMKMFSRRVMDQRHNKIVKSNKTPGKTIVGAAKAFAYYVPYDILTGKHYGRNVDLVGRINQRQRRKLWRHAPHMRKKYAA